MLCNKSVRKSSELKTVTDLFLTFLAKTAEVAYIHGKCIEFLGILKRVNVVCYAVQVGCSGNW